VPYFHIVCWVHFFAVDGGGVLNFEEFAKVMIVLLRWRTDDDSKAAETYEDHPEIKSAFSKLKESDDEVEWLTLWHHLISKNLLPKPHEWQRFVNHELLKAVWDIDLSEVEEF
jgi:hypothetical protein